MKGVIDQISIYGERCCPSYPIFYGIFPIIHVVNDNSYRGLGYDGSTLVISDFRGWGWLG